MKVIHKHLRRVLRPGWHRIFKDPRGKTGRWSIGDILGPVMEGMLGGCRNLRHLELLTSLGRRRLPDTTAWDVLVELDAAPLNEEIARGVKEAVRSHELDTKELPFHLVAIDGKSVSVNTKAVNSQSINRSQKGAKKFVNMVFRALITSSSLKLLMGQHIIPRGTNERGAFQAFIEQLIRLYGRTKLLQVVSVDAGITSKKNAKYLSERSIGYIMALKNQRSSRMTQEAIRLFENSKPVRIECEHCNGKRTTRSVYRSEAPSVSGWESAKEVWRIDSVAQYSSGKVVMETRYFVTSLPKSRLSNRQVLRAVRLHWGIENNANWVLDTAWQEDENPWCNKALELMTLLRVLAFNVIARLKFRRLRAVVTRTLPWRSLLELIQRVLFPFKTRELATVL
jgi:Transposase DDE domain